MPVQSNGRTAEAKTNPSPNDATIAHSDVMVSLHPSPRSPQSSDSSPRHRRPEESADSGPGPVAAAHSDQRLARMPGAAHVFVRRVVPPGARLREQRGHGASPAGAPPRIPAGGSAGPAYLMACDDFDESADEQERSLWCGRSWECGCGGGNSGGGRGAHLPHDGSCDSGYRSGPAAASLLTRGGDEGHEGHEKHG